MPSVIDSLPPALRTSTTGQGLAGFAAAAAATVASHYTANTEVIGLVGVLAGAVTLLIFPQATGAPAQSQAIATDFGALIKAYSAGLAHGSALAVPPPETLSAMPAIHQETSNA
jgi:hypothetical protein